MSSACCATCGCRSSRRCTPCSTSPAAEQRRVLCQVAELSARLVVMSERAATFLRDIYDVPEAKIDLIAHGIPDMPFVDPNFYKDQFGVEGKFVALTFGLLSPNKGIELMLRAMPAILQRVPQLRLHRPGGDPSRTCSASRASATGSAWSGWPRTWASSPT